ncbi:MAG: hypothetical protein JOS17DRAFT_732387 [Linnemannia elongata]|nr:MAG: hypothetical protein JOS17DRAFT_732387 [Linnemannia elongata]
MNAWLLQASYSVVQHPNVFGSRLFLTLLTSILIFCLASPPPLFSASQVFPIFSVLPHQFFSRPSLLQSIFFLTFLDVVPWFCPLVVA